MQPSTSPLEENNKRQMGTRVGKITVLVNGVPV